MLHLAQVQKKDATGKATLQLLAQQKSEHTWAIVPDADNFLTVEKIEFNEGTLVLVQLSNTHELQFVQSATGWVMELIEQYLTSGITPILLQQEAQRAEQWRQSLTLQSQELGRRALEMEARRDQIQELEENLKREKKELELMAAEMKASNSPAISE